MTQLDSSEVFLADVIGSTAEGERIRQCLQCGDCSGICPFGFAMDYTPRRLIAAMRADDLSPVYESDSVWLCVSCFACTEVCPSKIPLTNGLMTKVKGDMLLKGKIPAELQAALENTQRYGNPLGESPRKRADWTRDFKTEVPILARHKQPVDVLWFVGDYPSYHARVQKVSRAMAKIFDALGVSFGILGPEEQSDGDTQRLAGEKGLFELLANKNAKAIGKYKFKRIVTTDPHAYNAFKYEYPRIGITLPVQHHVQFLAERIEKLKPLMKTELRRRVTYHDPCYLGRANDSHIYDEPRALLSALPGVEVVEMSHNRSNSICCGGGGGGMWLDGFAWERAKTRTSEWRVKEAAVAGAEVLAVACPYETPRFEDAVKNTGNEGKLAVKDVAELIADAIFG